MGLLLSVETSSNICSVAIHDNHQLKAICETTSEKSHAKNLLAQINSVLSLSNILGRDLDAIAISMGPGSYTGLRIGMSTVKGLCYAWNKPIIGINTIESLAYGFNQNNPYGLWVAPMIDARRMEVYTGVFTNSNTNVLPIQPLILDKYSFSKILEQQDVAFFGDGSAKFQNLIDLPKAYFFDGIYPSAHFVGLLAQEYFVEKKFEELAYIEPIYLKEFDTIK